MAFWHNLYSETPVDSAANNITVTICWTRFEYRYFNFPPSRCTHTSYNVLSNIYLQHDHTPGCYSPTGFVSQYMYHVYQEYSSGWSVYDVWLDTYHTVSRCHWRLYQPADVSRFQTGSARILTVQARGKRNCQPGWPYVGLRPQPGLLHAATPLQWVLPLYLQTSLETSDDAVQT